MIFRNPRGSEQAKVSEKSPHREIHRELIPKISRESYTRLSLLKKRHLLIFRRTRTSFMATGSFFSENKWRSDLRWLTKLIRCTMPVDDYI